MLTQKKRALKGILIFLVLMALLTFTSRTIYYGTLPKVEVQRVNGGVLQNEITGGTFLLDCAQIERVHIPVDLSPFKLRIDGVYVGKYTDVQPGTVLLSFDAVVGENALENASAAWDRAEEALAAWDRKFQAQWRKLNEEQAAMAKKMAEPQADINALNLQLKSMQDELREMEESRMVDGVTRMAKERDVAIAKAAATALNTLSAQDWSMKSAIEGICGDVMIKTGDEYAGLLPLIELIPSGAALRVGIETDSDAQILSPQNVVVAPGDQLPGKGQTGWVFAGETAQGEGRVLWAEPQDGIDSLKHLKSLTFCIDSDYYPYVIPNSAVTGSTAYVLDSRIGSFGEEEYYARAIALRGMISDGKNTYVPIGLTRLDSVIVKWDRPFKNGDTVAIAMN